MKSVPLSVICYINILLTFSMMSSKKPTKPKKEKKAKAEGGEAKAEQADAKPEAKAEIKAEETK